jgi:hypothetical protein
MAKFMSKRFARLDKHIPLSNKDNYAEADVGLVYL